MPACRASRGELNCISSPSTRTLPPSCWCTPERILISVDLPAPLSPRMHVTSPALTWRETSCSARTLPKYLDTCSSWSRWEPLVSPGALISSRPLGPPPDRRVQHHSGHQHDSFEEVDPVRVPTRGDDPDLRHADDGRSERRSDDGAVAPRQQAAADDRRDDELELAADAFVALHPPEADGGHDPPEGGDRRCGHEEEDLRPCDGDAYVSCRHRIAARAEDPVAEAGACEDPGGHDREPEPPQG